MSKCIHSFRIGGIQYRLTDYDGTRCLQGIRPYDETEYHWARQTAIDRWNIYRAGKLRRTLTGLYSPENVGQVLREMDEAAHLRRRGGIW